MLTLRHLAADILREAGWDLPMLPIQWSPRMSRCAGLFVIEKDARGAWHPEIRLSIPLLRRRDRAWPVQVCGCHCHDPEAVTRRILEHELIHYKLWKDGAKDWGHGEDFRKLAWDTFHHQSITHGIGSEERAPRTR
ncbi:MAG: SprT-like domain-containing protein [Holophaga sp.]